MAPEREKVKCVSNVEMLESGRESDVTFLVGPTEERMSGHQLFLKVNSPVFAVMFAQRWNPRQNQENSSPVVEVKLPDVTPHVFQMFLKFLYGVPMGEDFLSLVYLVKFADEYGVTPLVNFCKNRLKKMEPPGNSVIEVYQIAGLLPSPFDFVRDRARAVMTRMFTTLIEKPNFNTSVDEETLLALLPRDDLNVDEITLFNALLGWSYFQLEDSAPSGEDIRVCLERLLPFVRFATMSPAELEEHVIPKGILTEEEITRILSIHGNESRKRKREEDGESARLGQLNLIPRKRSMHLGVTLSFLGANTDGTAVESQSTNGMQFKGAGAVEFHVNQNIRIHGFGFLGPEWFDELLDVKMKISRKHGEVCAPPVEKIVYAKRREILYVFFEEPALVGPYATILDKKGRAKKIDAWYQIRYRVLASFV